MPVAQYEEYRYYIETNRSMLSKRQLARRLESRIPGIMVEVDPDQPSTVTVIAHVSRKMAIFRVVSSTLHPTRGGFRVWASHSGWHYAVSNRGNRPGEVVATKPPRRRH
jgi:hypothetical protein